MRRWVCLLPLLCATPLPAEATPPLPSGFDNPPSEEEEDAISPGGIAWGVPGEEVWAAEAYAAMDWQAWERKVAERMEGLAEAAKRVPPMPDGVVSYVGQPVEELSLAWCTNAVPPTLVGDVRTWTFRVTERVAEDGSRTLLTHANNTVFHAWPVPPTFDPEAWSLGVYAKDGALPAWVAADEARRAAWFAARGRERLGLAFTMVEPGRLQDYKEVLEAQAEAIRREQEENAGEVPPRAFGATAMDVTPNSVAFGLYNPGKVDVDVVGFTPLSSPLRTYLGRIPAKGQETLCFEAVRPTGATTYFYRFLNGSQDTDGDGIPDGMEVEYFKTDPNRRDTAGSGMDDWRKIFVYGMDATVGDADGDGLPDGWELLHGLDPTSAEGVHGAEGDPDGDGLANRLEFLYGTHPNKADTDGDGLADREETGYATVVHHVRSIDTASAEEIVSGTGTTLINFPFPIRLGGRQYTQALASERGVLTFLNETLPRGGEPAIMGRALEEVPFRTDTHTLALYWGPIQWNANYLSAIRAVSLAHEGVRKVVVEYLNFARLGKDSRTLGRVQVEIPEVGDVAVRYNTLQGEMDAAEAVIGAQRPDGRYAALLTVGEHKKDAVVAADAVVYHFGSGTNPTLRDTDGDGVEDGAEVLAGTSPSSDDNDYDGMPDAWERQYGLNPHVDDGSEDPDGDTLTNVEECRLGTNPTAWDSDGDTLPDAAEVGAVVRKSHVKALDTSSGTVVYAYPKREVDGYKRAALPFPVALDGATYPYVALNADGFITFIPAEDAPISPERPLENADLKTAPFDRRYPTIALYWDNLMLAEPFMSTLRIVLLTDAQGKRTAVIEYLNIAKQKGLSFLAYPEPCTSLARIQVIIPENVAAEGIEVRYPTLQGSFDGTSATIGAQHRGGAHPEQFALVCNEPGKIALGDSITYFFGLGTDPSRADTDFDGLNDNRELAMGTDPHEPDTDGDGMSDGWEVMHGRSPTLPDDGTQDADGDGLTDAQEAAYKTDPTKADTDGDGIGDLAEINQSSDPTDATDGGLANSRKRLRLTFGDDSESHSEKYVLEFTQLVGEGNQTTRVFNEAYGRLQTHDVFLRTDAVYKVTMRHLASNRETPDRDYTLSVGLPEGGDILLEDEDGLIGSGSVADGEAFPGEGKAVFVYCFEAGLTPDYNRDGAIDGADEALAKQGRPLCMWLNDDTDRDAENGVNDGGDLSLGRNWQSGNNGPARNCDDECVNGKCDIEDFFPIRVSLGKAVPFYLRKHQERQLAFKDSGWMQILWCKRKDYPIERFYAANDEAGDRCFGVEGNATRWSAKVAMADWALASREWHTFPSWLHREILSDSVEDFVMFVEAKYAGDNPITLAVMTPHTLLPNAHERDLCALPVGVAPVTKMYAKLNLRQEQPEYTAAAASPIPSTDKMVAFVHGYSVSEGDAEGWFNTVFKRLWQSGLNAHFCGITWKGRLQDVLTNRSATVCNYHSAGKTKTEHSLGDPSSQTNAFNPLPTPNQNHTINELNALKCARKPGANA